MSQEEEWNHWGPLWWIDYMEGELEWPDKKSMEWMFRHNKTHREIFKNYLKLRRMVRKSDPVKDMPDNQSFHQQLHDKIMLQIDQIEMKSAAAKGEKDNSAEESNVRPLNLSR